MNKQSMVLILERKEFAADKKKHRPPTIGIIATHVNKGRVYPYASSKRGGQ